MPGFTENRLIVRLRGDDLQHYARTKRYARQVERLYNTACDELAQAAGRITIPDDGVFSFDDFPATRRQAEGILTRLAKRVETVITTGSRQEWEAACDKSDAFLNSILRTSRLTKDEAEQYQSRNLEALQAFQQRKAGGLGLSQRVWKYTEEFKGAIELGIDVAVGEGRSAQQLSRDLRQYLQQPDRLFRRVRDKGGNLRLSKAAAMFHPGQGVYRSSAKNAERLARTETNMAYREAEYLRWQQLDFVVGFRIWLSNNHTTKDSKGKTVPLTDICDELAGDYPKTFKFLGWHPQCRCVVTPIMAAYDEYNKDRANRFKAIVRGQTYKSLPSRRTVSDVPAAFRTHIETIADRAKGWKSMPYYIRDNFKNGVISGGLLPAIPQKTQMPGTTAKPPRLCTEFDAQIAYYKEWAYAYGLDVSALDRLRTSGDREALKAEIKRLQDEKTERRTEWVNARSVVEDFTKTAAGCDDVISEIDKKLALTEIKTTNYFRDCISRLKSFFASLPGKLKAATGKKGGTSKKMPAELNPGSGWFDKDEAPLSKEFFDLLDHKPNINIPHKGKGSFTEDGTSVTLDSPADRVKPGSWYRRGVVYHEFGHCIGEQRSLVRSKELTDLRAKHEAALRKREKADFWEAAPVRDKTTGKTVLRRVKRTVNQMRGKTIDMKLTALKSKIEQKKEDDPIFKRLGATKEDLLEQILAVRDTLRSLIVTIGYGHSASYFKIGSHAPHEYLAHCFENRFAGNRVFRTYAPDIYNDMTDYIKTLKAP